jgi:hypothetical protein
MNIENAKHAHDFSHLKVDAQGFIDYDYYQDHGRKLQAREVGNLFGRNGRQLVRDYLSKFWR